MDLAWLGLDFGWIWLGFQSIILLIALVALQEVLGPPRDFLGRLICMRDFVTFCNLCTVCTFCRRPGHHNQVRGHFWTSSGLGRVPRSLLGSRMLESGVTSALYSQATVEHFHVWLPMAFLLDLGPPRSFPMLPPVILMRQELPESYGGS